MVPLGRALALGLGDDGELGGLGVGVARREPAGDGDGRKEIYMYALTKPHGPCRGSSGSDMHKQIKHKIKTET